jgi:hypothetical protein
VSEGEGFLSRWSRRKRAAGTAPVPPPAAPAPPEAAVPPPDAEAPAFDPASLPPVESLTAESDFAAFLREEVPAALRRAALRRAWSLDPAIRDFVGPADYAWDYNAPDGVPGFSFDLPGDVKRLVAQAVGLEPEPSGGAPAPAVTEAAAPPANPAPTEPEEHAREKPPPAVTLDEPTPEALPAPAVPPLPPTAELSPARRRHGGALPS